MNLTDFNRTIWLILLQEGGYWTSAELATRAGFNPPAVYRALHDMLRRGLIASQDQGRRKGYGVTGTCLVPLGLRVAEVQA